MGNFKFLMAFLFSILFSVSGFTQDAKELLLNGSFESGVAKWKSYCDAAGITPVDGVGGGVAGFAISASTSSPLAGKSSGIITKDAVNRQGCGIATDFVVAEENKAQALQVKIPYKVTSGTYADDQYKVYVYDIDNASMIEVAPTFIKNSSIKEEFKGVFQTSLTGVNYRLIIHNASTSAVASTLKIEAKVSSQVVSVGSFATDWQSYTNSCSGSWTTNTTYECKMRYVGDSAEFQIKVNLTGAPNAVQLSVNLPVSVDSAKMVSNFGAVGSSTFQDSGVSSTMGGIQILSGIVYPYTSTYPGSGVTTTIPFTWGTNDSLTLDFRVPVVGKTSNTVLSSEYYSRELVSRANGSQTLSNNSETTLDLTTTVIDKAASIDLTANTIAVKSPGLHRITAKASVGAPAGATFNGYLNLRKNGSTNETLDVRTFTTTGFSGNVYLSGSTIIDAIAGDFYDLRVFQQNGSTASATTDTVFIVEKLSGGAVQVAAEQSVGARYKTAAGQSIANASTPVIDFGTKDFDDLGNVTTGGSWKFQPSSAGKFEFCVRVRYSNSQVWTATSSYAAAYLYKNGGSYSALGEVFFPATSTPSNSGPTLMGCDVVKMLSTDYVEVRTAHNESSARTLLGSDAHNWVTIKKVGNY